MKEYYRLLNPDVDIASLTAEFERLDSIDKDGLISLDELCYSNS